MTRLLLAALLTSGLLHAGRGEAIARGTAPTDAEFAAEFPWAVVLVRDDGPNICTGSLISPRYVLTAAHCTGPGLTVLYGNRSRKNARRVAVSEAIQHPQYTSQPNAYDAGLLRLALPLRVRPVPVASRPESFALLWTGGTGTGTIVGWGATMSGPERSDLLLRTDVSLAERRLIGTHIAFIAPRGGPCTGDSGGPLLVKGQDGKAVLVGIASITGSNLCQSGGGLSGYTDVAKVLDFIREHVPDLPERPPPLEFGVTPP